jgi:hypothetical protein
MSPLNPHGERSSLFARSAPTLAYTLLCITVVVLFSVNGSGRRQKPFNAISGVLFAPNCVVYGFYAGCLFLLGIYVGCYQSHPSDAHMRGIDLYMAATFTLNAIVWILWAYSQFFVAFAFAFLSWIVIMWVFFLMYNNRIAATGLKPPPPRTYVATSLVVSTYAGWLIYQMFLMLAAALTKADVRFFDDGVESGSIALVIVMSVLVFLLEWQYDDPHLGIAVAICLVGIIFNVWEVCGSFVIVVAGMLGFVFRGVIATLSTRFLLSESRFIASKEPCHTDRF